MTLHHDNRILIYDKGENIKLSENFNLWEFEDDLEDESNHFTLVSPYLITAMQQIRSTLGVPVRITSGFRTAQKNGSIGGATKSYHTKGMAADWTAKVDLLEFYRTITDSHFNRFPFIKGVGYYPTRNFIHIDVRDSIGRSVWVG